MLVELGCDGVDALARRPLKGPLAERVRLERVRRDGAGHLDRVGKQPVGVSDRVHEAECERLLRSILASEERRQRGGWITDGVPDDLDVDRGHGDSDRHLVQAEASTWDGHAVVAVQGGDLLDEDLAELYGVETGALTRAVRRNKDRFPEDFMFQLTNEEWAALRSQTGISNAGRGGRRYAPYVFTEQGVAMLSGVLRSKRAVAVNIAIMRAFVELRRAATSYAAIEKRLEELERETRTKFGQQDEQLGQIFQALRQLISPPPRPKRQVGFRLPEDDK